MFHLRIFITNLQSWATFKPGTWLLRDKSWKERMPDNFTIWFASHTYFYNRPIVRQLSNNFNYSKISEICFVKMDSSSTSKSTTRLLSQIFETFIYINFEIKSDIAAIYMAAFTPINDNYLSAMCERRRIKMRICDLHVSSEREIEFWQRSGCTDGS